MIVQGTSASETILIYQDTVANPDIVYTDSNLNQQRDGGDASYTTNQITGRVKVYGGAGNDELYGDDDNDLMYGGDNDAGDVDELEGDTLDGDIGDDSLYGEGGADRLVPGDGADFVAGGAGNDTFVVDTDLSVDVLDGESGTDVLQGTPDSGGGGVTDNITSIP